MESDKENVSKVKTKIPLPVNPLPAIPKHLLVESTLETERRPLRTISNDNMPGPSHERVLTKKKNPVIIDARYVTVRPKTARLDWHLNVFADQKTSNVSKDDTSQNTKECLNCVVNPKENCSSSTPLSVTPSKAQEQTLEPSRVKNLKRSLKRPHSREVQGLSPLDLEEKRGGRAKRQLVFNESIQDRLMPNDVLNNMKHLSRVYARDVFTYLISVEKKPLNVPRTQSFTRSCIINWLMKMNGSEGNPTVVQCACWYLDSILGTCHVEMEKLQLVAAACYWIAQKLHGPVYPASRLVRFSCNAFCAQQLLSAEKAVLRTLMFPCQPVVAQDFISYLSWRCDSNHPLEIETGATFLCMSAMMVDKSLCDHYPSVIAAASVRNTLLLLRKRNLMDRLQSCAVYRAAQYKAVDVSATNSILRKAVRMIGNPLYEYKAPFEHYGSPPLFISQRIASAANEFFVIDARSGKHSD